jgi:hypothetical protein
MTWQPALPRLEIALLFVSVYWVSHSGFAFGSLRGPFPSGSSGPDGSRSSYSPDLFLTRQLLSDLNPCSAFEYFGCCPFTWDLGSPVRNGACVCYEYEKMVIRGGSWSYIHLVDRSFSLRCPMPRYHSAMKKLFKSIYPSYVFDLLLAS